MAGAAGRSHRSILGYVVLLGTLWGAIILTASWTPHWGVDVLAGTRVVVTPQSTESPEDLRATADELEARARAAGAAAAEARVRSDGAIQIAVPGAPETRVLDALRASGEIALRTVDGGLPPEPVADEPEAERDEPDADADGASEFEFESEGQEGAGLPGGIANEPPADPEIPICPLGEQVAPDALVAAACGPVGGVYALGPVVLTGADIDAAQAVLVDGVWGVELQVNVDSVQLGALLDGLAQRDEVDGARAEPAVPEQADDGADDGADAGGAGDAGSTGDGSEDAAGEEETPAPARLALVIDGDLVLVAPTPPAAERSDQRLLLLGGLDQPDTAGVAERVDAGALPTPVASVDVIRLGSVLGPDEGARGTAAAGAALLFALLAVVVGLRRRGVLIAAASAAGAALCAPLVLLVDQVVGLPLGLPVALTGLGALGVLPMLAGAILAVADREDAGRTPSTAARVAGAEVWRRWWPPVAAGAVGAVGVRVAFGGEVGDVAAMLATVLVGCLLTARLVVVPLAVMLAPEPRSPVVSSGEVAGATDATRDRGEVDDSPRSISSERPGAIAAIVVCALLVVATAGLLMRGIAADPAFTAGEEHSVVVAGDPVDAREDLRDAVAGAGVTASSVRASGPDRVLVTTPRLSDTERADLTAGLDDVDQVRAPVASVEFEAAGSQRDWLLGGLVLALALLVGVTAAEWTRASPLRRAPALLAAVVLAPVIGLGAGSWFSLTWAPATLAALACITVVGVVAQATLGSRDHRGTAGAATRALVALTIVAPTAAVVVAAASVRAPFVLLLVGTVAAWGLAVVGSATRSTARHVPSDEAVEPDRVVTR